MYLESLFILYIVKFLRYGIVFSNTSLYRIKKRYYKEIISLL